MHQWHWGENATRRSQGGLTLSCAIERPTFSKTMMARPRLQSLGQDAPPSPSPHLPCPLPPSPLPLRDADGECRPFSPPVLAFNFYRANVSAIPLLVDFSSSVANSHSRAFRRSFCAQEKVPTNLCEYALGGARTHETDLYQARG